MESRLSRMLRADSPTSTRSLLTTNTMSPSTVTLHNTEPSSGPPTCSAESHFPEAGRRRDRALAGTEIPHKAFGTVNSCFGSSEEQAATAMAATNSDTARRPCDVEFNVRYSPISTVRRPSGYGRLMCARLASGRRPCQN
jgi:hypothetical protein